MIEHVKTIHPFSISVLFDKTKEGARRVVGVGFALFRGEAFISNFGDGKGAYSRGALI